MKALHAHLVGATMLVAAACAIGCTGATAAGTSVNSAREPVPSYQCAEAATSTNGTQCSMTDARPHSRGHSGKD
jgi:hypothetical protein